jgi:hypothetical protein
VGPRETEKESVVKASFDELLAQECIPLQSSSPENSQAMVWLKHAENKLMCGQHLRTRQTVDANREGPVER